MNPFNLAGPEFLILFGVGGVAALLVAVVTKYWLASGRPGGEHESVSPEQLAYLVGGRERAVEAAVASLNHRGSVTVDAGRLRAVEREPQLVADGVYRGAVDDGELSELERFVLGEIRGGETSIQGLVERAESFEPALHVPLVADGLLVADAKALQVKAMLVPSLWSAFGAIKIVVGLSRGKPVALLVLLVIALFAIALTVTKAPWRTHEGDAVVDAAKRRYAALEATASIAPAQLTGQDMSLAYAMFGATVFAPALLPLMPSYQRSLIEATSCSSSSGSGCGSSCSGGCGGGCGGCS